MATLRIAPNPTGGSTIELDGHDIAGALYGLTLVGRADADGPHYRLTLDLPIGTVNADDLEVEVINPVRDLLIRLGWTPPQLETAEWPVKVKLDGKAIHEETLRYRREKGL